MNCDIACVLDQDKLIHIASKMISWHAAICPVWFLSYPIAFSLSHFPHISKQYNLKAILALWSCYLNGSQIRLHLKQL